MNTATQKALAALIIIAIGYVFKYIGVFKKDDYKITAVMSMNITLPAAIITSFATFKQDSALFVVVLLGMLCNLLLLAAAWFITRKKETKERILPIFCTPGYLIGVFTLPYVGSILGAYAMIVACMFDIGNSILTAGGTYAIVSSLLLKNGGAKTTPGTIFRTLTSSVPFDIYIAALIWTFLDLRVPGWLLGFAAPIGSANFFVSMLMIGMMIDISNLKKQVRSIAGMLLFRYGTAVVLAVLFYRYTPFSLEIRQVLAIVVFSPISALAPIFTEKCGGDHASASLAGSVSILLSIICMTFSFILMGVS
ncbi:MAG: hypothetical protein LLF78_06730 [Synergistaceae bacterium]|nr:hypothetical protein [Synergistaceae bacterium]